MKTKRLLLALGVALLVLLGYNALIAHLAVRSQRQQALAAVSHPPADTSVVFLGNSLMEAGGDPASFRAGWPANQPAAPSLNLALGATTPVEHFLIWRRALAHDLRPQWLVYGFFDDQLNAPALGEWSDLVGNRAFSYYDPELAAELYAPGSLLKRWELVFTQHVPMLAERSSLWTKVERLRRQFSAIGLPPQKTNRFGRVDDFGPPGAPEIASFVERCTAITDKRAGFSAPISQIVQLAHAHQIRVLFVEMPMPRQHRAAFYAKPIWPRLRAHVRELASAAGATYLNASDWVEDEGNFADSMHLNPDGARVFSTRLARSLAQVGQSGETVTPQLAQGKTAPKTEAHP
ncbi:MAG: SGNH/GDSL hydrolase family protein [Opitutus sp.]|nr:SGNH/GDSL hydrolase family protein [Opitutus sp.]MCS6248074.1 SGNH/GDSL hydrolase family protein [Opitutus sp.]MCS6274646.1 SGNH/GDSL hydrolase family protein [Opitutus sp.]MCS6279084.1 SGNH/GDSL hydrolase family protein [Opitutus sp.]MCS6298581.1 SGNH/GDSL hydrolase family protein [Opitutus sp.]